LARVWAGVVIGLLERRTKEPARWEGQSEQRRGEECSIGKKAVVLNAVSARLLREEMVINKQGKIEA